MLDSIWTFLKDPANQAVFTWIGGGIVVLPAAFGRSSSSLPRDDGDAKPSSTPRGSVAIGGDNEDSPINIRTRGRSKR